MKRIIVLLAFVRAFFLSGDIHAQQYRASSVRMTSQTSAPSNCTPSSATCIYNKGGAMQVRTGGVDNNMAFASFPMTLGISTPASLVDAAAYTYFYYGTGDGFGAVAWSGAIKLSISESNTTTGRRFFITNTVAAGAKQPYLCGIRWYNNFDFAGSLNMKTYLFGVNGNLTGSNAPVIIAGTSTTTSISTRGAQGASLTGGVYQVTYGSPIGPLVPYKLYGVAMYETTGAHESFVNIQNNGNGNTIPLGGQISPGVYWDSSTSQNFTGAGDTIPTTNASGGAPIEPVVCWQ